jgi:cell division transport system permease protein
VLTHQAEIEVSRLLGATDQFISRPFHYFGLLQGLFGGLLAWLIVFAAVLGLRGPIGEVATLYAVNFTLSPLGYGDTAALLGVAAILGWTGAALSLRQHMRGQGG